LVRKLIGPVASFRNCIVVNKLPKTRSGKIIRGTLKKMLDGHKITQIPATVEDGSVFEAIWEVI
jgi:propionyl-CoA synthetase